MPRYKLVVEYDGTGFVGWQRQDNGLSVQQALEDAIFRFCGVHAKISGAGRTDARVHATGQVAHFDVERAYHPDEVQGAVNYYLKPLPVAVLSAEVMEPPFHARFSAVGRAYLYRIVNRSAPLALDARRAWWLRKPLDAEAMAEAAKRLLGTNDFTTFRASECQAKSPVKTLDVFDITRHGDEIRCVVAARSFLHHQVRNMVGTLRLVGEGKWTADDVSAALAARKRAAGGQTAPPDGLYLTRVDY